MPMPGIVVVPVQILPMLEGALTLLAFMLPKLLFMYHLVLCTIPGTRKRLGTSIRATIVDAWWEALPFGVAASGRMIGMRFGLAARVG